MGSQLASVIILGIDQSSDVTGAALLLGDELGRFQPLAHAAISSDAKHADSLTERVFRIADTAAQLSTWVQRLPASWQPQEVAYERLFVRGADATESGNMAAGAYLSIPELRSVRMVRPIYTQSAIRVKGLTSLQRQSAATRKARTDKRNTIKLGSVQWARNFFSMPLEDADDAIADAYAVAVAAWEEWNEDLTAERSKAAVRPLFGPGSRGGKVATRD